MGDNSDTRTRIDRPSDREVVAPRLFDAPPHIVFAAWTKPELFRRWWAPRSLGMSMVACDMDVRTGGGYRIAFAQDPAPLEFFGKYVEVVPNERLVWTNDEGDDGAVTTVTFEERGDQTLVTMSERYPTKQAFDASGGAADALPEQFAQLDELLATTGQA